MLKCALAGSKSKIYKHQSRKSQHTATGVWTTFRQVFSVVFADWARCQQSYNHDSLVRLLAARRSALVNSGDIVLVGFRSDAPVLSGWGLASVQVISESCCWSILALLGSSG